MKEQKYFAFSGALVLVIAVYSFGGLMMSYAFSFFAKSPPAGFALLIILNILVGKKERKKERKSKGKRIFKKLLTFVSFQDP